jgi:ubiquitin-activating enzyme E1 C
MCFRLEKESTDVFNSGAGGLGCEILKNLALSGFKDIHVIDMDTIDVSNLNRQFLFRASDVGSFKAEVAARFVEKRVKGVKITPYCGKIQDKDEEYYMQFAMIVCGLDSIEARRWINATLVGMVDEDNPDSMKPLVDGGTEGFKGQARVVFPTMTSCIECQLDMHAPRAAVPLCTLATIPRQPQHCIEWAHIIAWEEHRKDDTLDTDDPEHITWLYQKALARAKEFNIEGVTYSMTQGVVKNIIPAIASTNAIVAASCCNEAFKIATNTNPFLGYPEKDNYMMYTGDDSVYTYTFEHQKKDDCPVCGTANIARPLQINPNITLQDFIDGLAERPEAWVPHSFLLFPPTDFVLDNSKIQRSAQAKSHSGCSWPVYKSSCDLTWTRRCLSLWKRARSSRSRTRASRHSSSTRLCSLSERTAVLYRLGMADVYKRA